MTRDEFDALYKRAHTALAVAGEVFGKDGMYETCALMGAGSEALEAIREGFGAWANEGKEDVPLGHWTTDPPKESGWYYTRLTNGNTVLVRVTGHAGDAAALMLGSSRQYHLSEFTYWWSEPAPVVPPPPGTC